MPKSKSETPPRRRVIENNVDDLAHIEHEARSRRTTLDRASDRVARIAGSPAFVLAHIAGLIAWIVWNLRPGGWEPLPLFTLAVSIEAILLTAFVLRAQNRMATMAERRAQLDLQVDILVEREITAILQMMTALCTKLDVDVKVSKDVRQLLEHTNIKKLLKQLERKLPD